jgi:hypothetical protein
MARASCSTMRSVHAFGSTGTYGITLDEGFLTMSAAFVMRSS